MVNVIGSPKGGRDGAAPATGGLGAVGIASTARWRALDGAGRFMFCIFIRMPVLRGNGTAGGAGRRDRGGRTGAGGQVHTHTWVRRAGKRGKEPAYQLAYQLIGAAAAFNLLYLAHLPPHTHTF